MPNMEIGHMGKIKPLKNCKKELLKCLENKMLRLFPLVPLEIKLQCCQLEIQDKKLWLDKKVMLSDIKMDL